ncbi:MAG: response regulator, partial [Deltaproteobacteria bacterium]|nr:response regulator [Deltaproteobacteria bacterium]
ESKPGPNVMLAVTDSGTGMDEQTRFRIFEPFFTTKEMGSGTGLGLSTVYGIVKQNKGHISVYSEPGEGTTFKVYLPAVMQDIEGAKEEDKASVDQLGGTETVLLVEDDDMLCRMAQKILETHGYTVLSAHNSDEALKIANYHHDSIHLLLTDLVIPGMNGKELAGRIESILPGIKVLYMSGYTDNAIAHHGVLDRDINFIQKPFSPNDLVQKVREVLDRDIEDWKAQNSEPSAHLKY